MSHYFMIKEVSQFATDLIGCARKAEEVECVLKQTGGFGRTSSFIYPRLLLALDYKQKTFVAHPNVQQVKIRSFSANAWMLRYNQCSITIYV